MKRTLFACAFAAASVALLGYAASVYFDRVPDGPPRLTEAQLLANLNWVRAVESATSDEAASAIPYWYSARPETSGRIASKPLHP